LISELKWDSAFFKKKIGRLTSIPEEKKLKKLMHQASEDGYEYLTCRVVLKKISEIQILEKHGFYLTDTGVVWEKEVDIQHSTFNIQRSTFPVRAATIKDAPMLRLMVKGLFRDSRFYNDPFFTYREADRFYQEWIENSLYDSTVSTFIVDRCGFITCRKLSKKRGDISLVGVTPGKQGKGVGHNLVYKALDWFKSTGADTVTVRTQANNIKAMNFYIGMGFKVKDIDITAGIILKKDRKGL